MLAIHAAMVRLHDEAAIADASLAFLASTLLQLRPGDTLLTADDEPGAAAVLAMAQEATFSPAARCTLIAVGDDTAAVAAGHALALSRLSRAGDDAPVTVALLRDAAGLPDLLPFAGEWMLPLLLLVLPGNDPSQEPRLQSQPNLEVIRVAADDAVACCRVMQESLLRTRNRWGAVLLQGVRLPGAADPVTTMEQHLHRRKLPL